MRRVPFARVSVESLKRPNGRLLLSRERFRSLGSQRTVDYSLGVGGVNPNRCRHVSVGIVPPKQCLAGCEPELHLNQGCVLPYTTSRGDTMARPQRGAVCSPAIDTWHRGGFLAWENLVLSVEGGSITLGK